MKYCLENHPVDALLMMIIHKCSGCVYPEAFPKTSFSWVIWNLWFSSRAQSNCFITLILNCQVSMEASLSKWISRDSTKQTFSLLLPKCFCYFIICTLSRFIAGNLVIILKCWVPNRKGEGHLFFFSIS